MCRDAQLFRVVFVLRGCLAEVRVFGLDGEHGGGAAQGPFASAFAEALAGVAVGSV